MPLEQYLPLQVLAFLIVFTRIAAAVMILPGVGEAFVPMRVRLQRPKLSSAGAALRATRRWGALGARLRRARPDPALNRGAATGRLGG